MGSHCGYYLVWALDAMEREALWLPSLFQTTHIPVLGWRGWPAQDLWVSGTSKDFGAKQLGPESRKGDLGQAPLLAELFPQWGVVRGMS